MINPKLIRRFSIGHSDDPKALYSSVAKSLKNATVEAQNEIADIYFGRAFYYSFNGIERRYGDVMGKEASDRQVQDLLEMQESLGIPISLTINDINFNSEISGNKQVRDEFVKFIKSFYDAGVRVCTISDVHLMSTGALQEAMPNMHWKNTVNHMVRTAQEVVDYSSIGYNTILIDRSLNRDIEELKRIKKVAEKIGVKISLLASEGCMPQCPYKKEHDSVQAVMQHGYNPSQNTELKSYWGVFGGLSCNRWRSTNMTKTKEHIEDEALMPRVGTDIIALDKDTFDLYLDNTDILKFSGRLTPSRDLPDSAIYMYGNSIGRNQLGMNLEADIETEVLASSFTEIYEKNLFPFHTWRMFDYVPKDPSNWKQEIEDTQKRLEARVAKSVWGTKKAKALNKTLLTCKNQCYDCHACERVFGYNDFDSLLQIKDTSGWMDKVDKIIPIIKQD